MLKGLFDKCVKLASSKFADYSLAIVSFIESSFFPVPPDIMIVPMVVAKKEKYFKIFLIASLFSALGALLGYSIGFLFFNELGVRVFDFYGYNNTNFLREKFQTSGGSFSWLLILFFFTCLFARGLRFFIVAYLSFRFGSTFPSFLKKKGALWTTIIGLSLVLLVLIVYLVVKFYV